MGSLMVRAGSPAPGMPATPTTSCAATAIRCALVAVAFAAATAPAQETTAQSRAGDQPGDAARGARLFSGQARLASGGPPCGACPVAAGLPFPGGGTMGPDLTDAYSKYGPEPLGIVLTTLFFPTMDPLFAGRPLTPAERGDLLAFLAASSARSPPAGTTLRTFVLGVAVLVVVGALVALFGRTRLRGVRAPLVRAATRRLRETRR